MRKGFLLAVWLLALALCTTASPFLHGPYCGAPSAEGVTVSWRSEAPMAARVEYGLRETYESSGELPFAVDVPVPENAEVAETTHVVLSDLEPAQEYVYRVVLSHEEGETEPPIGSFPTEPLPGEPVTFAVLADTQLQHEGTNRLELVADAIAADPAGFDFILHAGDVVESPSTYYWDHWFASFDDTLLVAPFIPVLGNHEKNHRSYYNHFALPPGDGKKDEQWWALHWGDLVIVGLDSNVKKATEIRAQQAWAAEHLSGRELHKFVIFHHPVFTSDTGSGYFFDKIYHPIFIEHGVDIVFNGHSHHYEHIVRDGITYLVVGGGGATPRYTTPIHIQGSDVSIEQHFFYVRVETAPDGIGVECVSVAEEVAGEPVMTPDELMDHFVLPSVEPQQETATATRGSVLLWVGVGVVVAALAALLLGARGP